jgi:hypothetical protein
MLISNLSFQFANFQNTEFDIGVSSANFMAKFYTSFYSLLETLYIQEYYMKELTYYNLINDIFYLYYVLVKIQLVILSTDIDKRLTYAEYLEQYHGDCIFKSLVCRGFNAKKLMIAFDNGYSNINNIPLIESFNDDNNDDNNDYDGGISWFKIPNIISENNDFIIN